MQASAYSCTVSNLVNARTKAFKMAPAISDTVSLGTGAPDLINSIRKKCIVFVLWDPLNIRATEN